MLFQYGRYLLIASSRPGGLPANLQGKWNESIQPAVAQRLSHRHQRADELLAGRPGQPRRVLPALRRLAELHPRSPQGGDAGGVPHARLDDARRERHFRRLDLGMGRVRQRVVHAEHLGPLRLHRRQGISAHAGLPDDEGGLRVLARPAQGVARWHARRAQRLLARARPARGRRLARPATHLGPVQQHRRSRRRAWH